MKKIFIFDRVYKVPIDDICKKIRDVDNSNEDLEHLPFISDELRGYIGMLKKTENEIIDFKRRN